jgi:hypothetical protein
VFRVHGGRVASIDAYYDRERAFADLGIEG